MIGEIDTKLMYELMEGAALSALLKAEEIRDRNNGKTEISHFKGVTNYGVTFERWVETGELRPCRVHGSRRWYSVFEIERLRAKQGKRNLKIKSI